MVALSEPVAELAVVLARGYLRLTQKRRDAALSDAEKPQISLDVSRQESVTVAGETAQVVTR